MEKVVLDATAIAKLGSLDRTLELCDEQGRTLGYYRPVCHDGAIYAWARQQVSEQVLKERMQEPGGRTTAEVLDRLQRG